MKDIDCTDAIGPMATLFLFTPALTAVYCYMIVNTIFQSNKEFYKNVVTYNDGVVVHGSL